MNSETIRLPATTTDHELLLESTGSTRTEVGRHTRAAAPPEAHPRGEGPPQIDPSKDIDGFHRVNVGKMVVGATDCYLPCTPAGIQELLVRSGNDPKGKHVVVLGRSNIVGKPITNILLQKAAGADATVTICHSRTVNLPHLTKQADILIAAMGVPNFVKADMVRDGVVVHRRRRQPGHRPEREGRLQARRRRGLQRRQGQGEGDRARPRRRRPHDHHDADEEHGQGGQESPQMEWLRRPCRHCRRAASVPGPAGAGISIFQIYIKCRILNLALRCCSFPHTCAHMLRFLPDSDEYRLSVTIRHSHSHERGG